MRGLSKVAILSVAVIAIGGQLFAPPGDPAVGREKFIEESRTAIGRAWTETEVTEFQTTCIIPTAIRSLLTDTQVDAFFAAGLGSGVLAKHAYQEALEKLAEK